MIKQAEVVRKRTFNPDGRVKAVQIVRDLVAS